jgi:IS30 family transposase
MPYHHFTQSHRCLIEDLLGKGHGPRAIGRLMGRSHSSISRELRRNGKNGVYASSDAENLAQARLHKSRHPKRMVYEPLRLEVLEMLKDAWSPEIISAQLRLRFPEDEAMQISHESLYQWIYEQISAGELKQDCLWRPHKARQRRRSRKPSHSRIPGRIDIEQRPAEVDDRNRVGDWEGDSVVSKKNRGGIATFVERGTRFLVAGHLANKQASTFANTAERIFSWVPSTLCRTVTLDNGTEMAAHAQFSQPMGMDVYFAHPHSPWQRGTNEQVNGMIRRFFPKGTDFRKVTKADLDAVVLNINKRPRKCLNYRAPYDVFADALRGALVA